MCWPGITCAITPMRKPVTSVRRPAGCSNRGEPLAVCLTVLLEFDWVMRGYYGFPPAQVAAAMQHLLSLPHVVVQHRERVEQAISHALAGLDFADALHLVNYLDCDRVASFDDRRFARRAQKMNLAPRVFVPG